MDTVQVMAQASLIVRFINISYTTNNTTSVLVRLAAHPRSVLPIVLFWLQLLPRIPSYHICFVLPLCTTTNSALFPDEFLLIQVPGQFAVRKQLTWHLYGSFSHRIRHVKADGTPTHTLSAHCRPYQIGGFDIQGLPATNTITR